MPEQIFAASIRPAAVPGGGDVSRVSVASETEAVISIVAVRQSSSCEQQIVLGPRRKQQQHRYGRPTQRPVPDHRHERHDAGAACDHQDRSAIARLPDEMPAKRRAQLDLVAHLGNFMEEWRHLAALQPFDDQFDRVAGFRRRGDRIAALRAIAVRRRQPHADMLAGDEGQEFAASRRRNSTPSGDVATMSVIGAVLPAHAAGSKSSV